MILVRAFGLQSTNSEITFTDTASHWGSSAIKLLAELGIANGYGNGEFRPDQSISREELVVMVYRVLELNAAAKDLSKGQFADLQQASSYAQEAIQTAAQAGVINGKDNNLFDPKGVTTRAEAITIVINTLKLDPAIAALLETLI